ncbi:MAG: PQQ-binding-like beta-propeller repeat protein [Paludibacter sp.]|nr:PQQ-binding-like beta-propeller repeat protein [Paludibacter sp.]
MTNRTIKIFVVAATGISLLLLLYWQLNDPTKDFQVYKPGMDKTGEVSDSVSSENVIIGEFFKKNADFQSDLTENWPSFRGVNYDNKIITSYKINENWDIKEPKIVWQIPTGEGHAAPAIFKGLVYFIDYDETLKADILKCLSLETGEEVWRRWYNVHIKRNHGMSRTIPAVTEDYVVTMGPRCHVMCTERVSGNLLWGIDLEKQYKTETPLWYTGQCPIIIDNTAILAVGGTALMIAVDCKTGKILWETPNEKNWKMSHSSVIPMTIQNKKMFVYASVGGIIGISAEPADKGKILWEISDWAPSVIAPTPIYLGNNKIFVTGGYGAGGAILEIAEKNGNFTAKLDSKFAPHEGLASEQQTPIINDGYIYGIQPKDAGVNRNQLICYQIPDLKTPIWQSGKENRYGLGPYMQINDKFLILDDEGTLSMLQVSSKSFKLINQKRIFEGHDAWGPFAFANGYLLLRDSKNIYCLNLKP